MLNLPEKLLHAKEDIPESQFSTEFLEFKARQSQRQEERNQANIYMTIPGRILHMVRTSTWKFTLLVAAGTQRPHVQKVTVRRNGRVPL